MQTPYTRYCMTLHDSGRFRQLPEHTALAHAAREQAHAVIDFSSNDYLGLSRHPDLLEAAIQAGRRYGVGATGSRLLSGNAPLYTELESLIAQDKHTEAALLFSSGFQANLSVLACLLDAKVLQARPFVFFDRLNHASLYQAVFLSSGELIRYRHLDMDQLKQGLRDARDTAPNRPRFIVTETVFGMDGDCAPLDAVAALAQEYEAFLYLDEAHATGLFGPHGYGLSTSLDLSSIPHVSMGTFSKALGSSGAYVACSEEIRHYLLNKAQGFIYSTAPSPLSVAANHCAWQTVRTLDADRKTLMQRAADLRGQLHEKGFKIGASGTHIVPIIVGNAQKALDAKTALTHRGIQVSAVRPPTVPPNTARLRIALTTRHTEDDIHMLVKGLQG